MLAGKACNNNNASCCMHQQHCVTALQLRAAVGLQGVLHCLVSLGEITLLPANLGPI